MATDTTFVTLDIGHGDQVFISIVAQLVYDDGLPFALLPPGRVSSLPERVRLLENNLRKRRDASAGVPAMYDHPLVAVL